MVGVAQSMMACSSSAYVRGTTTMRGSAGAVRECGKSRRVMLLRRISAVKTSEECNEEDCAPEKEPVAIMVQCGVCSAVHHPVPENSVLYKEFLGQHVLYIELVGKLSMDWKVEDNSKVAGTYPPVGRSERKWTGYVEKDTAGQTNIYAVEPTVYVADSAISTGNAGGSEQGTDESLGVAFGLALIAVASASSILLSVGKNALTPTAASQYSGPPLSYYISKFSLAGSISDAIPQSPPLADELSISKPQVDIKAEPVAAASDGV